MTWFNESRIKRWDPLGLMPFAAGAEGFFSGAFGASTPSGPRADVHADDDRVVVRVELPGFGPDDVEVDLEGCTLWIRGEMKAGEAGAAARNRFRRGFRMPFQVGAEPGGDDAEPSVDARLENGVLEVRLVRATVDRPRRISVSGGVQSA